MMQLSATTMADTQLLRCYAANADEKDLEALLTGLRSHILQCLRARGASGEDLEDLCSETLRRFLMALRRSQTQPDGPRILDAIGYARVIAQHVYIDHVQQGRAWRQWKRRILELLDGKWGGKLFARWLLRQEQLGGFERWRGQPFRATARYRLFCSDQQTFCQQALDSHDPAQIPLPELLAHFFGWIGTPLEVGDLTTRLSRLQQLGETVVLSLEELAERIERDYEDLLPPAAEDVEARVLDAVAGSQLRSQLWNQITALLPRQRAALLLGMERDQLILLAETATQVTVALDLPLSEFAPTWRALPLSDPQIATRLEATPQQVSNLRKCAREKIGRWLVKSKQDM